MSRFAFALLSHSNPPQVVRLIHALTALYDRPMIVVHHDAGQCPTPEVCSPNVVFVQPYVPTAWGSFGIVSATLEALQTLVRSVASPDWIVLLSGTDYPASRSERVTADLEALDCDACIQHEQIFPSTVNGTWRDECVNRYVAFECPFPRVTPHGLWMDRYLVRNKIALKLLSPYSSRFRCFAGSQWFCLRSPAARRVLDWHDRNPWLARSLESRWCPDETFFHTVLCNLEGVRIHNNNFRFTDWPAGAARPRPLGLEDIPAVLASGCHFARKFAPDSPALDELDRRLGIPPLPRR